MLAASALLALTFKKTAGPKPKIRRDETLVFPLRTAEGFMQGPVKRGGTGSEETALVWNTRSTVASRDATLRTKPGEVGNGFRGNTTVLWETGL